jgi:hypothetical protein
VALDGSTKRAASNSTQTCLLVVSVTLVETEKNHAFATRYGEGKDGRALPSRTEPQVVPDDGASLYITQTFGSANWV